MKFLTRIDLREHLKRKELRPVYILFGQESYLRGLAAKTIGEFAFPIPDLRGFNEHLMSFRDSTIQDVISAAEQLPLGAERRVVIATELFICTNRLKASLRDNSEEVLYQYLKNPCETSVVVFVAEEFDKRLKAAKYFAEHAFAVEFSPMNFVESVKWVRDCMRKESVDANDETVKEIVNLAGESAGKLKLEVQKLATAALPEKVITLDEVQRLVKHSRILSNFDLTDHLVAGRREAALAAMRKILDDGAEPLMLLGLLSYNFRQLFGVQQLISKGLKREEIVRAMKLRVRPDRVFSAARRTEPGRFEYILKRLSETDLAIKTSRGTPRIQIEMLVCELALN